MAGASSQQLDATASVPGTFTYNPPLGTILHAGLHQSLSVTFKATDATDYTTATATVLINVDQSTLMVSWPTPGEITYGTALSAHQLDATASVPGTFTYSPPLGTVLHGGLDQSLSVTFTPTDATDYMTATATVLINVDRATPTVSWPAPGDITYGTVRCPAARRDRLRPRHIHLQPAARDHSSRGAGPSARRDFYAERRDRLFDCHRHDDDQCRGAASDDHRRAGAVPAEIETRQTGGKAHARRLHDRLQRQAQCTERGPGDQL